MEFSLETDFLTISAEPADYHTGINLNLLCMLVIISNDQKILFLNLINIGDH